MVPKLTQIGRVGALSALLTKIACKRYATHLQEAILQACARPGSPRRAFSCASMTSGDNCATPQENANDPTQAEKGDPSPHSFGASTFAGPDNLSFAPLQRKVVEP